MPTHAVQKSDGSNEDPSNDDVIGSQIRELRKAKGMTLQEVADAAGVSVGHLSQIERNQSKLQIGTLKKISNTLGVQIAWFFHATDIPADEKDIIVRADKRRKLTFTQLGIQEELLSPNLNGPLEMLMSTIEAGADSGDYSHGGVEAGLVISGTLDLWVSGQHFVLHAGDSFSFKSTEVHRCANPGQEPTKVVWIITPPQY
ncbi:MAG: helix-turn-helix domain-containing protein [Mesorhizobium sp.]|uniref:helix-turn-helix domain-containing protein n=1 Tax=Mesorhizobium sp. TaxID=1871066 RepID=UPI000FE4FAF8|nr:XRE family transcriptional regulator [Mesorhizobium sp.]RWB32184.1 MAG: helix-turn-helix domain-containing protein [Mesorhizobium sp.]RWB81783.1 MAG: helix-turn-helix domain-containing protein [Mesorhizobium sp.]RWF79330.1 MAG: helix-turn-helix domain-containing protein [Mesorhizobium sp.]TIS68496.1 MAG: helix-turn-helix domain-containing protein [Mesorhizobium sp.]TIW41321.1 MAG: helix-turn-helix domain-containing protein [Mesorhizobium sp.]